MIRFLAILVVVFLLVRAVRAILNAPAPAQSGIRRPRAGWDPWAVLGVPRGADRDEIVHAYREQIKLYHPDRVEDLGPELKKVAHDKTLELQRAYEELTVKTGG